MAYVQGTAMYAFQPAMDMGLAAAGYYAPGDPNWEIIESLMEPSPPKVTTIEAPAPPQEAAIEYEEVTDSEDEDAEPGKTGKKPPRQRSRAAAESPRNYTGVVPSQIGWSFDNLPDILYVFRGPDRPRGNTAEVPMKPSIWRNSPPLRCFSVLPDRISSTVEEFRVEAWLRLDRRIQLHDITDRMHPKYRIIPNTLQQRGVRFRQAFDIASWGVCNKQTEKAVDAIKAKLAERGISLEANITRGLTPGLINPALGEAGGRVPTPDPFARNRKDTTVRILEGLTPAPALAAVRHEYLPATFHKANVPTPMIPKKPTVAKSLVAHTPPAVLRTPTPVADETSSLYAETVDKPDCYAVVGTPNQVMTASIQNMGEIEAPRTFGTRAANLQETIENILQVHTREEMLEALLNQCQSEPVEEYERNKAFQAVAARDEPHFTPEPQCISEPQCMSDLESVQPKYISNPGINLLRKVQNNPGSPKPRIEKRARPHDRQARLSPARRLERNQKSHSSIPDAEIARILSSNGAVVNSCAQAEPSLAQGVDSEGESYLDISDDESLKIVHSNPFLKPEEENDGRRDLDGLDPATIRAIINHVEVNTETEFLEFCSRFNSPRNNIVNETELAQERQELETGFNILQDRALRMMASELDDAAQVEQDVQAELDYTPTFDELINIYEHERATTHSAYLEPDDNDFLMADALSVTQAVQDYFDRYHNSYVEELTY